MSMSIDQIVRGDTVLIRAGVRSKNLDYETVFDRDVTGKVIFLKGKQLTVDIPSYPKLRTYDLDKVEKYAEAD